MLKAFWSHSDAQDGLWHETHSKKSGNSLEIGILQNENPAAPEELKYSGILSVVGDNKKPCVSNRPYRLT